MQYGSKSVAHGKLQYKAHRCESHQSDGTHSGEEDNDNSRACACNGNTPMSNHDCIRNGRSSRTPEFTSSGSAIREPAIPDEFLSRHRTNHHDLPLNNSQGANCRISTEAGQYVTALGSGTSLRQRKGKDNVIKVKVGRGTCFPRLEPFEEATVATAGYAYSAETSSTACRLVDTTADMTKTAESTTV